MVFAEATGLKCHVVCGIICYVGDRPALPILLEGLKRLEYRGYDSAGLAVIEEGGVICRKSVGKIQALESKLVGTGWQGTAGLAQTRWATHGKPSLENAHPHADCEEAIARIAVSGAWAWIRTPTWWPTERPWGRRHPGGSSR